jgi:hypothetical protein
MFREIAGLLLGILIAVFHRPIAIRMMREERVLDSYFRQRGIFFLAPLSDSTAANLYFLIGIILCLAESATIWIGL